MSWPENIDMLCIRFLNFVSAFCSVDLSCFMIIHIFKDKHIVAGDINSLNLLVFHAFVIICLPFFRIICFKKFC